MPQGVSGRRHTPTTLSCFRNNRFGVERNHTAIGVLPERQARPTAAGHLPSLTDRSRHSRAFQNDICAATARGRIEDEALARSPGNRRCRYGLPRHRSLAPAGRGRTDHRPGSRATPCQMDMHRGGYSDRPAPQHYDCVTCHHTGDLICRAPLVPGQPRAFTRSADRLSGKRKIAEPGHTYVRLDHAPESRGNCRSPDCRRKPYASRRGCVHQSRRTSSVSRRKVGIRANLVPSCSRLSKKSVRTPDQAARCGRRMRAQAQLRSESQDSRGGDGHPCYRRTQGRPGRRLPRDRARDDDDSSFSGASNFLNTTEPALTHRCVTTLVEPTRGWFSPVLGQFQLTLRWRYSQPIPVRLTDPCFQAPTVERSNAVNAVRSDTRKPASSAASGEAKQYSAIVEG